MALQPPRIVTSDPGAHELDEDASSSSSDHFSSASEGTPTRNTHSPAPSSPIPITRVERVDDTPAHGEVPGTNAYGLRAQDAVPDEIEIVPEGKRSRSSTLALSGGSRPGTPMSPGGSPIPKTVVERVDDRPAHGEVKGTEAYELRQADAEPDEVIRLGGGEGRRGGREQVGEVSGEQRQEWFRSMWEGQKGDQTEEVNDVPQDDDNDFDDFAEGDEGDDDFGDFDEADETPMPVQTQPHIQTQPPNLLAHLPSLDMSTPHLLSSTSSPYLDMIFPPTPPSSPPPTAQTLGTAFLSPRSESLWHQLLQPPPMAPPNWTRSKIRRLFLVSLGVPVDLDEILPPSKVRRLILPNVNLPEPGSRRSGQLERLKAEEKNNSTSSLDSKTGGLKKTNSRTTTRRRKQSPPPPAEFDTNSTSLLCATTDAKLAGLSDEELQAHVSELRSLTAKGESVLEYWLKRVDEGLREKEALEGVIENLVGFVKGRRG